MMEHRPHLLREGLIDRLNEHGLPGSVNLNQIGPDYMLEKPLQIPGPGFPACLFCPGIALVHNALQSVALCHPPTLYSSL